MTDTAANVDPADEMAFAGHEIVIEPNRSWLTIDWRELWEYRDLLVLLVRRDFVARYKQTILGPLWFILQPLLMTIVFTVIFDRVARIPTDGLPPVIFYFSGLVTWGYFSQNLNSASTTFTTNAYLFTKVFFPRLIVPAAAAVSNLFGFAIQFLTFLAFFVWFRFFTGVGDAITIRWEAVFLPVLILHMMVLSLGVSLWMSSLTAKYRDFSHLMTFLTQLWMYATPIVIPLSSFPEKWRWVAYMNPMTAVVEFFRYAFLGQGTPDPISIGFSVAFAFVVFVTGVMYFNRTARTFVDTV